MKYKIKISRIVTSILIQPVFVGLVLGLFLVDGISQTILIEAIAGIAIIDIVTLILLLRVKSKETVRVSGE